jgi:SAM-dependent methyltransferase
MAEPSGSALSPEEIERRSGSFGASASLYERFRPGPPEDAVDWMLATRPTSVVDLGAGTGALTKLLVERADTVTAIEPDERMLAVLAQNLPGVTALVGRAEEIPLPDNSADAVLASSSWHWMDTARTLSEVARILVPEGVLGVVWAGPDPAGPFLMQAQALLAPAPDGGTAAPPSEAGGDLDMVNAVLDGNRPTPELTIPADSPFTQPERKAFTWDIALNADELIGLLGTFSWIITMPESQRAKVFAEARRVLKDGLGVEGAVTVDVQYRAEAWRSRLTS